MIFLIVTSCCANVYMVT